MGTTAVLTAYQVKAVMRDTSGSWVGLRRDVARP
jgi:hypothetical protein